MTPTHTINAWRNAADGWPLGVALDLLEAQPPPRLYLSFDAYERFFPDATAIAEFVLATGRAPQPAPLVAATFSAAAPYARAWRVWYTGGQTFYTQRIPDTGELGLIASVRTQDRYGVLSVLLHVWTLRP